MGTSRSRKRPLERSGAPQWWLLRAPEEKAAEPRGYRGNTGQTQSLLHSRWLLVSFTKKPLNYTQDNQPDNEHCPIRNGCYASGGLGTTWPHCQLTQRCQRAFTDCLPISEHSAGGERGGSRLGVRQRAELRPAGEPAMLASRDATSTEPGPGRAFTLRR